MSIVGPRPLPENIEKKIKKSLKIKRRKNFTGNNWYVPNKLYWKKRSLIEKIQLDLKFINNYTISNYFIILLKTPFILVKRF